MAEKINASMPPFMDLDDTFMFQFAALDPNTGAAVTGVTVSNVGILAAQDLPATADTEDQFVATTPLWLPIPLDEQDGGS